MVANTSIEWADHTFNPWIGCTRVSPACDHCYAAVSTPARTLGVEWGAHAERRRTSPSTWAQPRKWNRDAAAKSIRYRVFCASLADVFDNAVDPQWRMDLAVLIAETPNLDWLLLTKRIGNAAPMMRDIGWLVPPPNVWLGSTVVTQAEADRDVPKLLATPAARRFLSIEPLLGPVDLTMLHYERITNINALTGDHGVVMPMRGRGAGLDWVIVGGESGSGARPMHLDWARSLRDQCAAAGVPFLFKQWGEYLPAGQIAALTGTWSPLCGSPLRTTKKNAGRMLDGRHHDGVPA